MASILQRRVDAISARILHERRIGWLQRLSTFADWLALAVPAGYLAFRYLAKGTGQEHIAEVTWEMVAAALFIVAVTKLVLRLDQKVAQHSKLIGRNVSLASQAAYLELQQPLEASVLQNFNLYADALEVEDRESLGKVSDKSKKNVYRSALRELGAESECPVCHASPWRYKRGSCQACGNTPFVKIEVT